MLKILHGPVNIGNQPWFLSRHERNFGVRSDLVVNYSTWLKYNADFCLSQYAEKNLKAIRKRLLFGLTAPLRYNVLHYYFGRSFLCWDDYSPPNRWWFSDLKIAKTLGRKIFMTLQGCDVRLSAESSERNDFTPCHEGNCQAVPYCRSKLDAIRRNLIKDILPKLDRVFVLNPELAHFVPNAVFLPYAGAEVEGVKLHLRKQERTIKILHAPSDEGIKGTQLIVKAVERLKQYFPIKFILVKGLPHLEALKLYQEADLAIDQVLAGWYGVFAVEVMAMGKPVACYIREGDLNHIPAAMRSELPFIRLNPQTIEADLAAAITQRYQWQEWGLLSRSFVHRWHNPRYIAAAMLRAYQDPQSKFKLEGEELCVE